MPSMKAATFAEINTVSRPAVNVDVDKKREFQYSPDEFLQYVRNLGMIDNEDPDIDDGLPGWTYLNAFMLESMPEIPDVVIGLVRVKEKVILSAPPKGKKSFAAIDLTVSVTHGLKWFGKYECTTGNVLYINLEGTERGTQSRFRDVYRAKGIVGANRSAIWNLRGQGFIEIDDNEKPVKKILDIEKLANAIISRTTPGQFCLVVIDPIYKVFGKRNENHAGEIAEFMSHVDRIAEHTGAAVFMAHHFAKGDAGKKVTRDKSSGSNVFTRDPDVVMNFSPKKMGKKWDYNHFDVEVVAKDRSEDGDYCLVFDYPLLEVDEYSESNGGNSQVAIIPSAIAELVRGSNPTHITDITKIAKKKNLGGAQSVKTAVKAALDLGSIVERVIRDKGKQLRMGYCTEEEADIADVVLSLIPVEGISETALAKLAWDQWSFYKKEVTEAVEQLGSDGAIEKRQHPNFKGIFLFRAEKVKLAA